jgi:UDP-N-acetyl-2-amino-2-deoxyglucuronate dehydrogenase
MLRFGLLGCGRIAKRHSELLGGNHIDGASLVAVCDPLRPRADAVASKFGVPASYDTLEFLARKDIDVVAVLTPSGMHAEHVIACARAGKHVVVEKPMALRLSDADDMMRACDKAGVKLFVVKQNRFKQRSWVTHPSRTSVRSGAGNDGRPDSSITLSLAAH